MASRNRFSVLAACALVTAMLAGGAAAAAERIFVESARVDRSALTAVFPLFRGETADGRELWYIVLDASDGKAAERYGVNRSSKLANARGSVAVQKVTLRGQTIVFPATVDFGPERILEPGPTGFPPAAFQPGAVGEPGYSPLIQLPNGTILNAPHLANNSGRADKVTSVSFGRGRVTLKLTDGFANDSRVLYASTEASDPLAATLENATFAPQLALAPGLGNAGSDSSRAPLGATLNGQTGRRNPERQGFTSALLDGLDPLNALAFTPNQGNYSPLWDVHLGEWTRAAVAVRDNVALKDFDDFEDAADDGLLTGPDGSRFGPAGIVVNCPIIVQLN